MADPTGSRYSDPYLTEAAGNISKAFSPAKMGEAAVQGAHISVLRQQGAKLQREAAGRSAVSQAFANLHGREATPEEISGIYSEAAGAGMKGEDLNQFVLGRNANTGQTPSVIARSFAGAGHAIGKDQGVTLEDREGVAARDDAAKFKLGTTEAGIHAGATIQAANIAESGRMARRYDAPHNVAPGDAVAFTPGDTRGFGVPSGGIPAPKPLPPHNVPQGDAVFLAPGDPRFAGTPNGSVPAPKPPSAADHVIIEDPVTHKPVLSKIGDAIANRSTVTTARPPADMTVGPTALSGIIFNAQRAMGGIGDDKNTKPEFTKMYGAKLDAAATAAGSVFQKTRDAAAAEKAYRETLGADPGSTFEGTSMIGRLFGSQPGMTPPAGAPPVSAAPAAAPAPAEAAAPALPETAAATLREGVHTKFGNGQTWTKKDGVPVQVP